MPILAKRKTLNGTAGVERFWRTGLDRVEVLRAARREYMRFRPEIPIALDAVNDTVILLLADERDDIMCSTALKELMGAHLQPPCPYRILR